MNLSEYPAEKIRFGCSKCGLSVQYDKQALLSAGGDRTLAQLIVQVQKRSDCPVLRQQYSATYDTCQLIYTELVSLMKANGLW